MTAPLASVALSIAHQSLLTESGGSWPPHPSFEFPAPLDELHKLCVESPNVFAKTMDVNQLSKDDFAPNRAWLEERLPPVSEILAALKTLNQNQVLGISATFTILSHLYRWGTIPSLTAAQEDTSSSLPNTLLVGMLYLNTRLGFQTSGGTLSSTYYNNWDQDEDRLQYAVTVNFDQASQDAEYWTVKLFVEMEHLAAPLYACIGKFVADLEAGHDSDALEPGVAAIKEAFAYFYKNLKPDVVRKDVWARYVQSFYDWGWDGFGGVSGNQAFMVRFLDAVLGIPNPVRPTHLSKAQRDMVWAAYDADLRALAEPFPRASKSLAELIRMLKTWRLGHSRKAIYYEDVELPERRPMTGGYGTDANVGLKGMIERMSIRLKNRAQLTV